MNWDEGTAPDEYEKWMEERKHFYRLIGESMGRLYAPETRRAWFMPLRWLWGKSKVESAFSASRKSTQRAYNRVGL